MTGHFFKYVDIKSIPEWSHYYFSTLTWYFSVNVFWFKSVPFATIAIWNLYSASYFHNLQVVSKTSFQDLVHQLPNLQVVCNMVYGFVLFPRDPSWFYTFVKHFIIDIFSTGNSRMSPLGPHRASMLIIPPWNCYSFKQVHFTYYHKILEL